MESHTVRIDPAAEGGLLQEEIPSALIEKDLRVEQDHPLLPIATTPNREIAHHDANLLYDAHLLETTGEEEDLLNVEPEAHPGDILPGEMMVGERGLGHQETTDEDLDRLMTGIDLRHVTDRRFEGFHHQLVLEDHIVHTLEVQTAVTTVFLPARVPQIGDGIHLPLREIQVAHLFEPLEVILDVLLHMFIQAGKQLSPPRGPATFRPPTGPGGGRNFTAPTPSPTLSASGTPMSMSAHNRSDNASIPPPAGPRAQFTPSRGGYVGRGGRGSFGHDRQTRPDPAGWGAAPSRAATDSSSRQARPVDSVPRPPSASPSVPTGPSSSVPTGPSGGIPTGPRAGAGIPSRPLLQHSSSVYGSRTQSTASSGPRPHPAMANMPHIIPGGRIDPTASGMSPEIAARLKRREEEEAVLRADLEAKTDAARKSMREFERMKNESAQWRLRSDMSANHLSALIGEGASGPAF
ncbi:hypothetical protein D0Z07_6031 [Hyphodiscus hymeniophilus]|uniref:Uncharacterized protein n=1 Tax=Hyphodiscus hymeniophilus TaxID=353542 RepID=A0A9P6VH78_9HELO|nr:hypothetical protein D0Z07_6031 [Hyphodiscus hymeniophilus]